VDLRLGLCCRHQFAFPPLRPLVDCHNIGADTFFPLALQYRVLTVLILPTVSLVIDPVRSLTVVLGAVTRLRFLTQPFRDTVTNILTFLRLLHELTNTGFASTGPSQGFVTVVVLTVSSSVTLPGTKVTLTVAFLFLAFVHFLAILRLMTFHRFTSTESTLARTVVWVCTAGTISVLITFRSSEEWIPSNDAIAKVTDTGGILDTLTQAILLTVLGEAAGPYVGGGDAGGHQGQQEEEESHPQSDG